MIFDGGLRALDSGGIIEIFALFQQQPVLEPEYFLGI